MRIRDPNGAWKHSAADRRLLVPRAPDEAGGEYWRLLPEGMIEGADRATHRRSAVAGAARLRCELSRRSRRGPAERVRGPVSRVRTRSRRVRGGDREASEHRGACHLPYVRRTHSHAARQRDREASGRGSTCVRDACRERCATHRLPGPCLTWICARRIERPTSRARSGGSMTTTASIHSSPNSGIRCGLPGFLSKERRLPRGSGDIILPRMS